MRRVPSACLPISRDTWLITSTFRQRYCLPACTRAGLAVGTEVCDPRKNLVDAPNHPP
eukprot:CAMPEP_0196748728 /NCGR_PEP_ID=MMETSP1091-20130531/74365_1 /TAXON_ID=302021 /ORGANISM="Rhodomonas sp., Strain CCMP768" /LENGTH=57 /DNA_ID=CAMNT_0042096083 /DNA_START=112 /DNA_END=281 /DNA_ORIENTATION=+